ncbi:hypothetical protein PSP6_420011 [Paraburkholderia tropica]|nr:hypothetical protein PSP6_420011 [Paraburkholderia tropica]
MRGTARSHLRASTHRHARRIHNAKVGGSIPLSGTKKFKHLAQSSPTGLFAFRGHVGAV